MAEFINTADVIGDDELCDQIIMRTVTEYKDNQISKIGKYAFNGCTALTTVDLPNVTEIAQYAFKDCTALTTVDLPNVTDIGINAFDSCGKLDEIAFPKVQTIHHNAFINCRSLPAKLTFPCVTKLSSYAFRYCTSIQCIDFHATLVTGNYDGLADVGHFQGCAALIALILRSETMCTLHNTSVMGGPIASGTGFIYVPRALVDSYKTATNWSTYSAQFRALEDYTVDGTTTGELDESKI